MKNRFLYFIIFAITAFVNLTSCKDNSIPIGGNKPEISFVFDTIVADMNQATNVPIVAVVNSEVGLASVQMYIEKTNGETVLYKEIKAFLNNKLSLVIFWIFWAHN